MSFSVPVVDITPYVVGGDDEARAEVARAVDRACSEVGFIQVLGHGVPEPVTDGLAGAMDEFFALAMDAKRAYRTPAGINRGYAPPKTESLSLSLGVESANRMNDFFEAFNVGLAASDFPGVEVDPVHYAENTWPDADAPGFRAPVEAYFAEAGRVARTMTRIFADALGVDHAVFATRTDHSLDVLRMNNYALPAGTDVRLDGDLTGMGEHTDYGIVTVLWADRVRGLQVLGTDGGWHDVSPDPGALLINLGDLTARWTNERWMSTLHRVKPPIVGGTIERRRSAAYFHDGNADALIEAIPTTVPAGEEPLYPPITVGDHIAAKLAGSREGRRNAPGRETARVLAARDDG
ncbi:isopenicillin N synthase family dioxygenase [Agromyces mangrovi Wang et al. 2018]|uniref:isopenicillin N synthase family dioxygenase n=1 Tax=Agromyces mangrovi TaxID=1858653 RepID=UPI002573239A|nr:2-oxoglutarate and iron-dependent oxygenase domain-containing protein [Agromyces mangrovi]BDZ63757.1 2OG-Fe(II) oxygenase [Agromyces mangrovi]